MLVKGATGSTKLLLEPILTQDYWHQSQYNLAENVQHVLPKFIIYNHIFRDLMQLPPNNDLISLTLVVWCFLYITLKTAFIWMVTICTSWNLLFIYFWAEIDKWLRGYKIMEMHKIDNHICYYQNWLTITESCEAWCFCWWLSSKLMFQLYFQVIVRKNTLQKLQIYIFIKRCKIC